MKKELLAITHTPGAHFLVDSREIESRVICTVQLIGAQLPYDVQLDAILPYTKQHALKDTPDPITHWAQYAATHYHTDPQRTHKAAAIVRAGDRILPRATYAIVKSDSWSDYTTPGQSPEERARLRKTYQVSKGLCTCPDHIRTHGTEPCKHRIALFIYTQINPTPHTPAAYWEQRYCESCNLVHWLEIPPYNLDAICHGSEARPREDSAHFVRRVGKGFEVYTIQPR